MIAVKLYLKSREALIITRSFVVLILIVIVALAGAVYYIETTGQQEKLAPLSSFGVERIEISNHVSGTSIHGYVYIASTSSEQTQGLMGVENFGNCNGLASSNPSQCLGMIFIVSKSESICLWMHNTLIPLQQVWISQNGTVTSLYQAQPENDNTVCNPGISVLETSPSLPILTGESVNQSLV